ncbi:hypothetical protein [Paenibacillus vini]|uniref:Uncharacterized protein n=1 Tax=Paenibacillus vini TaxID=1476024 RepID=A0ABQ4M8S5_9BACL|nr:hypothetical protein [Paenibacillus vini]GIP51820.1 hypothetical protein J42TS3_08550 [Paenibacillus vini]
MIKQLKSKFPAWTNDQQQGKYDLCLSNDLDSLLSCLYLKHVKGYEINYFYDFTALYNANNTGKPLIGVDMALERGKVWDNHITKLSRSDKVNPDSANVNAVTGISRDNYYTKYCGSTLLQIISFYNIPLPLSREGKIILLAIDSTFLGYFHNDFRAINRNWLEQLELYELLHMLDSGIHKSEFYRVKQQYNLDAPIKVNENGILETEIDLAAMQGFFDFPLSLSAEKFNQTYTFNQTSKFEMDRNKEFSKHNINGLFSIALTHKNKFKYTSGIKAV